MIGGNLDTLMFNFFHLAEDLRTCVAFVTPSISHVLA